MKSRQPVDHVFVPSRQTANDPDLILEFQPLSLIKLHVLHASEDHIAVPVEFL